MEYKDLQCQANVSDYKWLSKTLKTAQQQSAVRPFYECKVIDDFIVGDVVTNPTTPLQGSAYVAPDGDMFAVGLDSSNNVGVWKGDTSVLSGAPTVILENNAHNRSVYNHYSIACSDWIAGSYKLDVYFFGNWDDNAATGVLSILHYYSMDKGVTWKTDQVVNDTLIPYANTKNIWIVAGKPYQENDNKIVSIVFYIEPRLVGFSGVYSDIAHQKYFGATPSGSYQTAFLWSRTNVNTLDWLIHSFDVERINGFYYVAFSGYHKILEPTNQKTSILNYSIYISKIISFSSSTDSDGFSLSIWTSPEPIISSLSTSPQNKNSFTFPSLFYDETNLWVFFKGDIVSAVTNDKGASSIVVSNNYFLAKSVDFENFNYPVLVVLSSAVFNDTLFYSFFLQGGFYWVAGGGQLGKFIINNILADISNDIISYDTRDIQQNPSTLSINIGNADGKWRGANPTQAGYQAIDNNKKITLFQGYYNADGKTETIPKNTYYIDDIQQNVQANRNDFSLLGRDLYKNLKVLKTKFAFNYTGIKKYIDLFDGTTLGNYNILSGRWSTVGNGILYQIDTTSGESLAIFSLYKQSKANTTFSVNMSIGTPIQPSGTPIYIYFYYVDSNNYLRLVVDFNGSGTTYDYRIESCVSGSLSTIDSGTFSATNYSGTFTFLFKRYNNFLFDIYVGLGGTGRAINEFSSVATLVLGLNFALFTTGLGTVAFGGFNAQIIIRNFKYLEFDNSLNINELSQNIGTKAGIFEYKFDTLFEDYFFTSSNYSGVFTTPNNILTIQSSQTVLKNDLQIGDSEIDFEAKITPPTANASFSFDFIFRNTGLVNQNENYYFTIGQTDLSGNVTNPVITLYNTHTGTSYSMQLSASNYYFDYKLYHKFRVVFFQAYIFLIIDGIVVCGWFDNNETATHTTGYIGFRTTGCKLEVKNVVGSDIYTQIETFAINPGDDLESSLESLLSTNKVYSFSDLLGRLKILRLNSTDVSEYTYQDQITTQQVDNSDKEYVNQVTVIGSGVQTTVQDLVSINVNNIVREEVIVDYKITTYQDALDRANLELINFNKFNNQYSPRNVINVGSEVYDVVTVINTGDNTSNVNQVVRNYSQKAEVGGSKLKFWQTIQTGTL